MDIRGGGGLADLARAAAEAAARAIAAACAELAEPAADGGDEAVETAPEPTAEQTQHAWRTHASDPGAAALEGRLQHSVERGGGRHREELTAHQRETRGPETRTDTARISSESHTERSGHRRFEDGRFSIGRSVRHSERHEVGWTHERTHDLRQANPELVSRLEQRGQQISQALQFLASRLGLGSAQLGGSTGTSAQTTFSQFHNVSDGGRTETAGWAGGRASAGATGSVGIGPDGLQAEGHAEARAGLYANVAGRTSGDYGSLEGSAGVKAEVYATADGSARLDANGLEVRARAEIGAEISAEVHGTYRTPSVNVGGVPIDAEVTANGRATLEARAYAEGKAAFTLHPPRAILEGEAGASAVAKLEGDITLRGGPFSLTASGYVSAGAEARATGAIGYEDGKLRLSFGLGAALGFGAGGDINLEVDVRQLGQMAVGLAEDAAEAVGDVVEDVADAVGDAAEDVVDAVGDAAEDVVDAAGDVLEAGADFVSSLWPF